MKKSSKKILLAISSVLSLSALPIAAISCSKNDNNNDDNRLEAKVEMDTKIGISIATNAINQKDVSPTTVIAELKAATTWEDVLKVLSSHGIKFNTSEAPETAKYAVNPSSHAHPDEGQIHLDITQTLSDGKLVEARFTINGFKEVEEVQTVTYGGYTLSNKSKLKVEAQEFVNEVKEAQKQGFDKLLEVLKKYVDVTVEESKKDIIFSFGDNSLTVEEAEGAVELEEVSVYNKSTPDQKTLSHEHFDIGGFLKK